MKPDVEAFYEGFWGERIDKDLRRDELERWAEIERLVLVAKDRLDASPSSGRSRVLDLGCGRGWMTRRLTDLIGSSDVVGIDPVTASVDLAKSLHAGLDFRIATGGDLLASGERGTFDLIVSSEVVEHVARGDQPRFLAEAFALLRPGGFLIMTTPRGELWRRWRAGANRLQPVEDWLSERQLDELARGTGFAVVERSRVHVPNRSVTWPGWIDKWILGRRYVRDLPLAWLRRRMQHAARVYQVALLRRPHGAAQ